MVEGALLGMQVCLMNMATMESTNNTTSTPLVNGTIIQITEVMIIILIIFLIISIIYYFLNGGRVNGKID